MRRPKLERKGLRERLSDKLIITDGRLKVCVFQEGDGRLYAYITSPNRDIQVVKGSGTDVE